MLWRVAATMATLVLGGVTALPAAASQAPREAGPSSVGDSGVPSVADGGVRLSDQRLDISGLPGPTSALWMWPQGRRAYTIARRARDPRPGPVIGTVSEHFTMVVKAYDLDSLETTGSQELPHVYAGYWPDPEPGTHGNRPSRHETAAVDEARGLFYIAHSSPTHGNTAEFWDGTVQAARSGQVCASAAWGRRHGCLAGVYVLDARTLDVVRRFPISDITVDGAPLVTPMLIWMEYAPPTRENQSGKLYLVVMDAGLKQEGPHDYGVGLNYLLQVDPDLGTVDWAVRLDGCRGRQRPRVSEVQGSTGAGHEVRPQHAAVLRSPFEDAVWVGCHNTGQTAALIRVPLDENGMAPGVLPVQHGDTGNLAGKATDDPLSVERDDVAHQSATLQVFPGPRLTQEFTSDPASGRFLLRVVDGDPLAEVWWVFDTQVGAFVGTVGIGRYGWETATWGLDRTVGRLYVLGPVGSGKTGGLFMTDMRRTPLPQALNFPEFAKLAKPNRNNQLIMVDRPEGSRGQVPRLFFRPGSTDVNVTPPDYSPNAYHIIEDTVPVSIDNALDLSTGRTLDLDEVEGVTQAVYDGAARGFAARALVVGGVDTVGRAGPVDSSLPDQITQPVGLGWYIPHSECSRTNRQVVLGFVGPRDAAVVDANGSRGGAEPVVVDSATRADSELPASRCGLRGKLSMANAQKIEIDAFDNLDWDRLWSTALFGQPPVAEPAVPWQFGDGDTQCLSTSDEPSDSFGDPVAGAFASKVECGSDEANGFGYARGASLGDVTVSEAISRFRIYRDPGRGIVSRIESVARGINVSGQIRIDMIRGSAESWANGRKQPLAAAEREEGYDPNCDFERTAGTCFQTAIFGVRTPTYSCGPCGDEQALVEGLTRAMGSNGRVRLRQPDPSLQQGSDNGYIAAIQKPAYERFSDVVLNDDLLQTVLPTLEIVKYTTPGLVSSTRRGLQVYQFAGVEVSSSYGIQCLLVYDEATNTCGTAPEELGSIRVQLVDIDGNALAGGAFEVRSDVDADGVVGLVDELVGDGACLTGQDGTGTCVFDNLPPGPYLASQTAAPAGYGAITEPWVSEVAPGEARTVTFTNASNLATIEVSAQDEGGRPLEGARFAVYADTDADGKVTPGAAAAAQCVSDAEGTCRMRVPVGSYVLVQTAAPAGLEPIEPLAFALTARGQVAAVGVVNSAAASRDGEPPAPAPARISYSVPPALTPSDDAVARPEGGMPEPPLTSLPDQLGGTITRVIRAPADALRLLTREPVEAVAWTATLVLLVLALVAVRRRALLGSLAAAAPAGARFVVDPGGPPAARPHTATALLDPPAVAGASPPVEAGPVVAVVAASRFTALTTAVRERLEADERCRVLAVADSLPALREILREARPDVLVLDLALPTGLPEDVCDLLPGLHPPERTIGLVRPRHSAEALITRGFKAGLAGLLDADEDLTNGQLALAVRTVARGRIYYGPAVQSAFVGRWGERSRHRKSGVAGLTERELQVARLAAEGLRRSEIAARLYLSPHTVKGKLRAIRTKLGVANPWDQEQLRRRLREVGLLDGADTNGDESA